MCTSEHDRREVFKLQNGNSTIRKIDKISVYNPKRKKLKGLCVQNQQNELENSHMTSSGVEPCLQVAEHRITLNRLMS